MPDRSSYDFATLRVVPRVEREEFLNAGVVLFCLERKFLRAAVALDQARLHFVYPGANFADVCRHLESIEEICAGYPKGGEIGKLTIRERFHWVVSPRSAVIQVSAVHSGLCSDPQETLHLLMQRLVR